MPQLVKGGKHTFGWVKVNIEGRVVIPPEAFEEYHFSEGEKAVLMPGSRKSRGFGLTTSKRLNKCRMSGLLKSAPELFEYSIPEGEAVEINSRIYCWVKIVNKAISIPGILLREYGIKTGEFLLTVRGSKTALGFAAAGPIIEEAERHPELVVFE
jgi:bifunctional DNA-binding transcriptional regulator/antitoxin component of YhaV-PrlF toxin-antitoxin module